MRLTPASAFLLPLLSGPVCLAGELTVEGKPFVIERTLATGALPSTCTPLRLEAKTLAAFEIKTIAAHGSRVKSGEVLVSFDTDGIDRKLDDSKRAIDSATLSLGQVEVELKGLKDSLTLKLDATKRAARNAAEDLAYFNSTSRKIKEQRVEETLKRYRQALRYPASCLGLAGAIYAWGAIPKHNSHINELSCAYGHRVGFMKQMDPDILLVTQWPGDELAANWKT
jgi:hypothetical protein